MSEAFVSSNINGGVLNGNAGGDSANHNENGDSEHDPHFEPIISLPEVNLPTLEEEEVELIKLRAKLFRYDTSESPPEWKERGTGDVKLLRHKTKNTVRVLMRRDKTLKICANHFVTPMMELKRNCGSDRAWVWSVIADFADETIKSELLAIRFANSDNASKWKDMFEKAKYIVATECKLYTESPNDDDEEEEEDDEDEDSYEESEKADDEERAKASDETPAVIELKEALGNLEIAKATETEASKAVETSETCGSLPS